MLLVENLAAAYGTLKSLHGVSLEIAAGELVALIGSNGAGKTTLLNAISGLVPVVEGGFTWEGRRLVGLSPDRICREGIIQVPEGRKLFPRMTVEENLEMGAYAKTARKHLCESREMVFEIFPHLATRRRQIAGSLSGGEQQMVALARALMARPRLLMLDEPSLGLAPNAAANIFQVIADLNRRGLTVLLVSQEIQETLSIAGRGYVLENGRIALSGPAADLLADPRVKKSYLGL